MTCRPGSMMGLPLIFPFNFRNAITDPEKVIAPIARPSPISIRLASPIWPVAGSKIPNGPGAMKAAAAGGMTGPVDRWLGNARAVRAAHADEIDALPDDEARVNRFVEVNVRDQLLNLAHTTTVQDAFARGQPLVLYGWVYDIRDGLLKPLMEIDRDTVLGEVGRPDRVLEPTLKAVADQEEGRRTG